QALLGAGHADVAEAALFFEQIGFIDRAAVREQAVLQAGEKYQRELEALGIVQRHQRDRRLFVVGVSVGDERGVIEEVADRFAALGGFGGGVEQFIQILDARFGFGRLFGLQHPLVAGAIKNELDELGQRR